MTSGDDHWQGRFPRHRTSGEFRTQIEKCCGHRLSSSRWQRVLSETLPSSSCLPSTCREANVEKVIADQMKNWNDVDFFGAYKSVDSRSKSDNRTL